MILSQKFFTYFFLRAKLFPSTLSHPADVVLGDGRSHILMRCLRSIFDDKPLCKKLDKYHSLLFPWLEMYITPLIGAHGLEH